MTPKERVILRGDSYNDGAAEERRLWMRRIRGLQRDLEERGRDGSAYAFLEDLRIYGEARTKRNKAKAGGL